MTRRSGSRGMLTLLAAAFIVACGGGERAAEEGEPAAAEERAPAVPPDSAAHVSGVVNFEGTPPEAEPIDMREEPRCAAAYGEEGPMTRHVLVSDGKLENVFVYVKSGLDRPFPTPRKPKVLDQENCRYHPHVMGMQVDQTLEIQNSDSLLHNIKATPSENRGFNISQPAAGMTSTRSFAVPEVMIPVQCDVHGWMNSYIGVLEHPYYAVSASDGSFALSNLPPGEYTLEAWHERYGTLTETVSVSAKDTASVSFTFSADMAGAEVPLGDPIHPHAHADRAEDR